MNLTFPNDTEDVIDAIRGVIGRTVGFFLSTTTTCPTCSYDPVNDSSTDSFCPTCSGLWYIKTYTETLVTGHISWGYSENLGWVTGGQLAEGSCRVQIKNNAVNLDLVNRAEYLIVDAKKMSIVKKTLRGVPTLNRILLDLQEIEEV